MEEMEENGWEKRISSALRVSVEEEESGNFVMSLIYRMKRNIPWPHQKMHGMVKKGSQ